MNSPLSNLLSRHLLFKRRMKFSSLLYYVLAILYYLKESRLEWMINSSQAKKTADLQRSTEGEKKSEKHVNDKNLARLSDARAYYFLCQLQLAFSWFTPPPEKLWIYAVCRQTFFLLLFDLSLSLSRVPFRQNALRRAHNFADCVFACGCRAGGKSWSERDYFWSGEVFAPVHWFCWLACLCDSFPSSARISFQLLSMRTHASTHTHQKSRTILCPVNGLLVCFVSRCCWRKSSQPRPWPVWDSI